ncbi:hypothetical protein D9M71_197520 [compost metagenome]
MLWGDTIEGSAREILAEVERIEGDDQTDDDDPADALRRILNSGPLSGKDAKRLMTDNGFTQKQIRTAREKLSVVTTREGFGKDIKSYWSLPSFVPNSPFVPSESHSCPLSSVGTNEEKGHEWANGFPGDDDQADIEDRQESTKNATENSDGLQEKAAAFGDQREPDDDGEDL